MLWKPVRDPHSAREAGFVMMVECCSGDAESLGCKRYRAMFSDCINSPLAYFIS